MEAFLKESNRAKAVEVLFFEEAEIEKIRSDSIAFAATGPMSVLYFKDYNRFVLQINDWKYPLLRRIRVISNSTADNLVSRSYFMPAMNGYTFNLKINKIHNVAAILNFETILANNSDFSYNGMAAPNRNLETSPDDKLVRKTIKNTGAKEVIAEKAHSFMNKIKVKAATIKTGTKHLTSTKKRMDMTKIKNKNFKKMAKPTIKKNFFADNEKMTVEFMRLRRENKNMFEAKDIHTLAKTTDAPALFIVKEDIEECILNNKDMAAVGNYNIVLGRTVNEKRDLLNNVKFDLEHIKENFDVKKEEIKERIRINEAKIEDKIHMMEASHHDLA